jgi:hypothetical protein
VLAQQVVPAQ